MVTHVQGVVVLMMCTMIIHDFPTAREFFSGTPSLTVKLFNDLKPSYLVKLFGTNNLGTHQRKVLGKKTQPPLLITSIISIILLCLYMLLELLALYLLKSCAVIILISDFLLELGNGSKDYGQRSE
jgi:hypothetical protein